MFRRKQKSIWLALLLSISLAAHADYYMALPKTPALMTTSNGNGGSTEPIPDGGGGGGETPAEIPVSLALGVATLADVEANSVFEFNFAPHLTIAGDNAPSINAITWTGLTLPDGLSLSAAGVLSGSPTTPGATQQITIRAAYNEAVAEQSYQLTVTEPPVADFEFSPVIATNINNYNLKTAAMSAGWDGIKPLIATVTVKPGVVIGSSSTATVAFDTGSGFPEGSSLKLVNNYGYIVGKGGSGGSTPQGVMSQPGTNGGTAIQAQFAIVIDNQGTIGGGGGGGGSGGNYGSGGGGGAGYGVGGTSQFGYAGQTGTFFGSGAGGSTKAYMNPQKMVVAHGSGGSGGNLGEPGGTGAAGGVGQFVYEGAVGGVAGAAVMGNSFVTWQAHGTVLGPKN